MYGFVYKLTNMDNGKIYVGQTRRPVEERFHEHKYAQTFIGKAIRKHGVEKFMCEVLAVCETKEELDAKEIFYINYLKANNPQIGYNRTGGGEFNQESEKNIVKKPYMGDENFENTGLAYVMKIIKGKYKLRVLYTLMEFGVVRFGEMKRYLGDEVSFFMLNRTLKELEADNLTKRKEYEQLPPKVEYSLTERGKSLIPLLDMMCDWGEKHKN